MSASTPLAPKTDVTCFPNYHSPFLKWWPYPARCVREPPSLRSSWCSTPRSGVRADLSALYRRVSYCLSSNVLVGPRMPPQDQHPQQYKLFGSRGCALTPLGESLKDEMGNEKFLGSEMENLGQAQCDGGRVDHPLLFVGRQVRARSGPPRTRVCAARKLTRCSSSSQDQWNPCACSVSTLETPKLQL